MHFAVLMRKQSIDNPWISYRWAPQEVLPDFGQFDAQKQAGKPICGQFLARDEGGESWLFTGYELNLFPDEAEGYYLNVSATTPSWFVMWRQEEDIDRYIHDQSIALAKTESTFAARLLDGGESVDTVLMSEEHAAWLQDYVNEKYRPEPKQRHKPASFKGAQRQKEG